MRLQKDTLRRLSIGSLAGAGLTLALLAVPATHALADDLIVDYDQVQLLRLPEPAGDIIIGNSGIAEINVQSKDVLVVTGKSFGVTNMIVLNRKGQIILNQKVMVRAAEGGVVTVNRGGETETFNCLPKCEPIVKLGDNAKVMDGLISAVNKKNSYANGESQQVNNNNGGNGGGNNSGNAN